MKAKMSHNPTESGEQESTVVANCMECGDQHPVGDRSQTSGTTTCPRCGDTRYTSEVIGETDIKPDDARIRDAVQDVKGIGEETCENIISAYETYYDFEAASAEELNMIDGVGKLTSKRIVDNR